MNPLPKDKKLHFAAGFGLIMLGLLAWPLYFVSVIAAFAKELWDGITGRGTVEAMDVVWTLIGAITGFTIIQLFKWFCD